MSDEHYQIKRGHYQYTQIENLKEHEFTECIAFELAVRAAKDTIIELIKIKTSNINDLENINDYLDKHKKIRELEKKLINRYWLKPNYFMPNYKKLKTSEQIIKEIAKSFNTSIPKNLWFNKDNIAYNSFAYIRRYAPHYIYHYTFFQNVLPEEYRLELCFNYDEYHNVKAVGFGNTSSYSNEIFELESYTDTKEKFEATSQKKIARPPLAIPKEHKRELTIKINPYLPIKENMNYIEELLKYIQEYKPSLTMNELIKTMPSKIEDENVETYENIKNSKRAKFMADSFFIYDYVTYTIEFTEKYNKVIYDELKEPYLDKYDKEELKQRLSEFTNAKKIIMSDDYGKNLEDTLGKKRSSIYKNNYLLIDKMIANNEYKNLI